MVVHFKPISLRHQINKSDHMYKGSSKMLCDKIYFWLGLNIVFNTPKYMLSNTEENSGKSVVYITIS